MTVNEKAAVELLKERLDLIRKEYNAEISDYGDALEIAIDSITELARYKQSKKIAPAVKSVAWNTGSLDEIVEMLDEAYGGKCLLNRHWNTGDERPIHLKATKYIEEQDNALKLIKYYGNRGGARYMIAFTEPIACLPMNMTPTSIGGFEESDLWWVINEQLKQSMGDDFDLIQPLEGDFFTDTKYFTLPSVKDIKDNDFTFIETDIWLSDTAEYNEGYFWVRNGNGELQKAPADELHWVLPIAYI